MENDYQAKNKAAWQYRAYEFFVQEYGVPVDEAQRITNDPRHYIRLHEKYLPAILTGVTIANVCGSHGRIAAALSVLGATVTVFDISEENKRYAMELASEAGVSLNYVVGDFCAADQNEFGATFDFALAELGILHYFHDLSALFGTVGSILKAGGTFILSDFHPFRKILSIPQTDGDYFDERIHEGDVAYQKFFSREEQAVFPKCLLRYYTMSEIVNSLIGAGFAIKSFDEHPGWDNAKVPGWYHIQAIKMVVE